MGGVGRDAKAEPEGPQLYQSSGPHRLLTPTVGGGRACVVTRATELSVSPASGTRTRPTSQWIRGDRGGRRDQAD